MESNRAVNWRQLSPSVMFIAENVEETPPQEIDCEQRAETFKGALGKDRVVFFLIFLYFFILYFLAEV